MRTLLIALFTLVLVSMLGVTTWASLRCPLFAVPRDVFTHPWFIATLFDTYWAFLTFFVWVCYQQQAWLARLSWFVAILLLGNIAMASYCLAALLGQPRDGRLADLLVRRSDRVGLLGPGLAVLGIAVVALGWPKS